MHQAKSDIYDHSDISSVFLPHVPANPKALYENQNNRILYFFTSFKFKRRQKAGHASVLVLSKEIMVLIRPCMNLSYAAFKEMDFSTHTDKS